MNIEMLVIRGHFPYYESDQNEDGFVINEELGVLILELAEYEYCFLGLDNIYCVYANIEQSILLCF